MKYYERIRNLREDADLSQEEVSELLHVSQRAYSYYEIGKRGIPTEILIELANIYKVNMDYLVGRTDVKKPLPPSDEKNKMEKII